MTEEIQQTKNWHDKYYKILLIIPAILIIFSFIYMINFYAQNGDFIKKDISLTGGTSVTLYEKFDVLELKQGLQDKLSDINIREVYDLITQEQKAVIIETTSGADETKKVLEDYLKYELTDENSSFEFTGSSLSQGFYKQLLIDILITLVVVNILGIEVSTAGLVAFLMLIGYSVDTDILLTSRVLKREGDSLNKKIFDSFKTGMTMTLTALFSVLVALFIVKSFSSVLAQIFTILAIGLGFDMFNTWITNVSIIKWYMKNKHG